MWSAALKTALPVILLPISLPFQTPRPTSPWPTSQVCHPSVSQMVAVAAHSFSSNDLLRVERILLDGLEFATSGPHAYTFLHLLTQATLATRSAAAAASTVAASTAAAAAAPPLEAVVSLAMFLTELAMLDGCCLTHAPSNLATAALLLAHATLGRGDTSAWPSVLAAAGTSEAELAAPLRDLAAVHAAAVVAGPAAGSAADLAAPLLAKFSAPCWCRVAADVPPLLLQQQQQQAAAAQVVAAAAPAAVHSGAQQQCPAAMW